MSSNRFRLFFAMLLCIISARTLSAQIGYQVSLLNSATGEPRANETVTVQVSITNNAGAVIYSGSQQATTNDFGVLSLSVGNAGTFSNVDWSKLPFFISATVGGQLIGRTQILSVPIAEAAKTLVNVDKNLICRTWQTRSGHRNIIFKTDNTFVSTYKNYDVSDVLEGKYKIIGDTIYCCPTEDSYGLIVFFYLDGRMYDTEYGYTWH